MSQADDTDQTTFDVIVVGGGMAGLYGVHRFTQQGLRVLGLESAADVGGVWYHNRYPGARVDIESKYYCYYFDPELYRDWQWSQRYANQAELLAYLNHVADRYDLRRHYRFNTRMTGATWDPSDHRYQVVTDTGQRFSARYLVMATGPLSYSKRPDFAGIDSFEGEVLTTSHWPHHDVQLEGRRVGVIGTGSSGVQTITAVAKVAGHLHVFQRTPNYVVPARNRAYHVAEHERRARKVDALWQEILASPGGMIRPPSFAVAAEYTEEERILLCEERWAYGGSSITVVFKDQGTNPETNELVAEFIRSKVRQTVDDPVVAERLVPDAYPLGVRRLIVEDDYYETYNRSNVSLVDIRTNPILGFTPSGVQTADEHLELDVVIFALGFHAFTGSLNAANIRNEHGEQPSDGWSRGPRTFLGLMTSRFPNLFIVTGPGSPSVLANMNVQSVFHMDLIGDLIAHMAATGATRVEPTLEAEDRWTDHVAEVSESLVRRQWDNYMVHVNDDGTRVFIPYTGGFDQYVGRCRQVVERGYEGLAIR